MIELFIFGTWLFWANLSLMAGLIYWAIKEESVFWSAVISIGIFAGFYCFNPSFAELISVASVSYLFLGYLAVGVVWSFFKWFRYVKGEVVKFNNESGAKDVRWFKEYKISPKKNKAKIYLWITFWPWSAVQTALGEFLVDFLNAIFKLVEQVYNKISNSAAKDLK